MIQRVRLELLFRRNYSREDKSNNMIYELGNGFVTVMEAYTVTFSASCPKNGIPPKVGI